MNDTPAEHNDPPLTRDEMQAALFAQMVMHLASTALILMGRAPNPMNGKTETDLDAAQMFVEQLEMLEAKTQGNLSADEQRLLKQNLMTVRLAFVQTVEGAKGHPGNQAPPVDPGTAGSKPAEDGPEAASKKKFSKTYGEG